MRTLFEFTLPRGYVDPDERLHRKGVMRLATARDEIECRRHPAGPAEDAYVTITLLCRVVERIGEVSPVTPAVVESLFASDFAYLQELYLWLNDVSASPIETVCPACGARFGLNLTEEQHGR